jgi:hypothetical protein
MARPEADAFVLNRTAAHQSLLPSGQAGTESSFDRQHWVADQLLIPLG